MRDKRKRFFAEGTLYPLSGYRVPCAFLLLACFSWQAAAQDVPALKRELEQIETRLADLPQFIPSAQTHERIGFHGHAADPAWIQLNFGREVTPERVAIFPARLAASLHPDENGFPSAFEIQISNDPEFATHIRIVNWREESPGSALKLPFIIFPGNGASGQYLRLKVTGFRQNKLRSSSDEFFHIGEIVVMENGQNVALHPPLKRLPTSTRCTENPRRWDWQNVSDGRFWFLPLRGKPGAPKNGFHSELVPGKDGIDESWVEVALGKSMPIDEIHFVPAHPIDFPDAEGFGFPLQFRVIADPGTPDEEILLTEVQSYPGEALPNPGATQLVISTPGLNARTIRLECVELWRRGTTFNSEKKSGDQFLFAMAELQMWHAGVNIALGQPVNSSDTIESSSWSATALVDGYSSREKLLNWDTWLDQIQEVHQLQLRAESLRQVLQLHRDQSADRWRNTALAGMVLSALIITIVVLILQSRAARAREALRSRIARDLHDEIGASLSHLAIQSHLAGQKLPAEGEHRDRLESISKSARETFDNMRDIVWMLNPTGGTWEELDHRLEAISKRMLAGISHEVVKTGTPPDGEPPVDWARRVVAILKESLSNARRHSGANRMEVVIDWGNGTTFEMKIIDDGCGFDKDSLSSGGQGLENMQSRARALGGELEVAPTIDEGTTVTLRAPM